MKPVERSRAQVLASYLADLNGVERAWPVKVTIGDEVFYGAGYIQKLGDKSIQEFEVLGQLPQRHGWTTPYVIDGKEWFIVGYYEGQPTENHPFGQNWTLRQADDLTKVVITVESLT